MEYKPINILLVEDHKLIRVGIKTLFDESHGYNVIAEAETGKEAIEKALKYSPDIVLLDLGLPDMSGLKVIKALTENDSKARIIILSSRYDENEIIKALAMGIYAYVIKDVNTELLLYIVKSVYNGAMWLDPKIVPILREKSDKIVPKKQTSRAMFRNIHANHTQREYEVL